MLPDLTIAIMNTVCLVLAIVSFVGGQVFLFHEIRKWGDFVDKHYRP